jgi:hypothetical protein
VCGIYGIAVGDEHVITPCQPKAQLGAGMIRIPSVNSVGVLLWIAVFSTPPPLLVERSRNEAATLLQKFEGDFGTLLTTSLWEKQ